MSIRPRELSALADALAAVLPLTAPADVALRAFFRARHALGQHDRAFVAEGVFAALRRLRSLKAQAQSGAPRRLAIAVALRDLGLSLRELEPALSSEERDWARDFKARKPGPGSVAKMSRGDDSQVMPAEPAPEGLSPGAGIQVGNLSEGAEAVDLPDWLWDALGEAIPAERAALARAWLAPAPLDLRVNPLKTTREAARSALAADGIESVPTPYSPLGLRVAGKPALQRHALFESGAIEVQDEGSQLLCYLVAPRRSDMVIDFCAGAGGKTLLLGALMRSQGRLYAFDVSAKRLANLKPRLRRSGLSNVHPVQLESERDRHVKRLAAKADRVLVDAPCSGFGTLRRNPDLKWRQQPGAIAELAEKQSRLIEAAGTLVKPGGRLVYATCSVLPEENEAIVEAFLARHPDFALGDAAAELARAGIALETGKMLHLYPHRHGCDGFFAAVLEREPSSRASAARPGTQ